MVFRMIYPKNIFSGFLLVNEIYVWVGGRDGLEHGITPKTLRNHLKRTNGSKESTKKWFLRDAIQSYAIMKDMKVQLFLYSSQNVLCGLAREREGVDRYICSKQRVITLHLADSSRPGNLWNVWFELWWHLEGQDDWTKIDGKEVRNIRLLDLFIFS